jgi:hypothetical protein
VESPAGGRPLALGIGANTAIFSLIDAVIYANSSSPRKPKPFLLKARPNHLPSWGLSGPAWTGNFSQATGFETFHGAYGTLEQKPSRSKMRI